jgi:DNA helicase-2/ATP-dependent DNA helicase PcrA
MIRKIDYAQVLNPAQLEAVLTTEGPVLVIAGAGSGKTRTLVYRVARLVEEGVNPEEILLLTFTRKAAEQMLERAAGLADPRCRFVSGGTFHSLAYRVLRTYAERLGFQSAFTILDRSDMEDVIHHLLPELHAPKDGARFPKRSTLANILSKAANLECSAEEVLLKEYGQFEAVASDVQRLAALYGQYKTAHQLMDYDDLILSFRRVIMQDEEVRTILGRQYRYIMVDEYQDTNTIQADIVSWLAREHRNVMVVGDDSQSIYSFRGANYRNMFEFPTRFPEARTVRLEENYRSTQPILNFTNALMERASQRYTKCLFTRRTGGEKPRLMDTRTEPEQAITIARTIREEIRKGRSPKDIAVLFRAAYHSFQLEVELTRQGIPYVKYGGFKFMESAHIKDCLSYLRAVTNWNDALSWGRILRMVKNVGPGRSQSIFTWMRSGEAAPGRLAEWPGAGKSQAELKRLADLLERLLSSASSPAKALEAVMEYYQPILREKFDDYPRRQRELDQLLPMAGRYKKLRGFLDDLALDPPTSSTDMDPENRGAFVTLSTVHSAKGLEWPMVFIIWLMEGRFPSAKAYADPELLEEERRLMYVAATRCKDRLILSYPSQEGARPWQAGGGYAREGLSSFVAGLSHEVLSYTSEPPLAERPPVESADDSPIPRVRPREDSTVLSAGDRVSHPAFGAGVISKLVDTDKVEVIFRNFGRKLLHLQYTTLEKV